jgi:hypothetical protein
MQRFRINQLPFSAAEWQIVQNMFCNFYLVRNRLIGNDSPTAEAGEKNKHRLGILKTLDIF